MRKIIIPLLGILLLLISCNSFSKDTGNQKVISMEEKQFIFEKNKECFNLNDKAKEKRGEKFIDCGNVKILDGFYSPSINSCIHGMRSEIIDCDTGENKYGEYFLNIKDYYSNENIITFPCSVGLDDGCESDYKKKIEELKK